MPELPFLLFYFGQSCLPPPSVGVYVLLQLKLQLRAVGPLGRLGLWAACMLALVVLAELIAVATAWHCSLLGKGAGGAVLLLVALVSLMATVADHSRRLSDYGLATPANWRRQALLAAGLGALIYSGYLAFAWMLGAANLRLDAVTPTRCIKAVLSAVGAMPVAAVQQIIFAGVLLGTLRLATSRLTAVLMPAVLFGAFAALAKYDPSNPAPALRLLIGMTLLATLLGAIRLRTGNIVVPAGLLAGAIVVRRVANKLRLVEFEAMAEWTPWLAPGSDPRQAPAFWAVLAMATAGVAVVLARYGERHLAADAAVAASFKRVMPFSNLLAFAPIDRWLAELFRARFRVGLAYVPRLLFTLIASTLTTIVALPERLLAPLLLRGEAVAPVFIIGMHRSGTTHLHNLLALDPQFRSPRNFEVFNPHGFITGWLTTLAMTPLMVWRRPMDSVQMSVFSSQEDEFALAAMGGESPYWMFPFPRRARQLARYWHPDSFSSAERRRWRRNYQMFLRKLVWRCNRRLLLKNPVNTSRVAELRGMYPDAKFVYIVRHPHQVYQSNLHFAEHGFAVFQLQDAPAQNSYATDFLRAYRQATDRCEQELLGVMSDAKVQVRFEDLESRPIAEIERIYQTLGMPISTEFRRRLVEYLDSLSDYSKNRFSTLTLGEQVKVDSAMGPYLVEWGYQSSHVLDAA